MARLPETFFSWAAARDERQARLTSVSRRTAGRERLPVLLALHFMAKQLGRLGQELHVLRHPGGQPVDFPMELPLRALQRGVGPAQKTGRFHDGEKCALFRFGV